MLTSCSLFPGRNGLTTGDNLPLTVQLRTDPSIAGAQLSYQDACGQPQSLSLVAPLEDALKQKISRVFKKVLTGEVASSSMPDGYVDIVLGMINLDLAIVQQANRSYPATITVGLDFAYTAADGTVLHRKKIQSIGRGDVDVTASSCEVKGLDKVVQEAFGLVTDGMAKQLGTSSKILNAADARKAGGVQAAAMAAPPRSPVAASGISVAAPKPVALQSAVPGAARVPLDESAKVIFRAIIRDENRNQVVHSGEAIAIELEVKNDGPGIAKAVELLVTTRPPLIERIPEQIFIGDLQPGEVKHMTVDGKVGLVKEVVQGELTLTLRAGSSTVQLPNTKKFLVAMKPESVKEAQAQPVDVDDLPKWVGLLKQPKAIGIVIGVGQFRESGLARVKYAARDAEAMARYLTSVGGIPHERVRTLLDAHALKSDVAEVLEEWLPMHVDLTTVVYLSITGRGVVDPMTGAVSLLFFDSTPTSSARLYSLRRVQESLMSLPIQQAIVMLDLSLELAPGKEASSAIGPMWAPQGGEKDRMLWMVGNRSIQESYSYDPGQHGLFAYQLLKGMGGAADLDRNGTILAGELCTYTRGQVMKVAREQYGKEQEPLCIPAAGQGSSARLQPVAKLK